MSKIDGPRACTKADLPDVIALVNLCLNRVGTDQTMLTDYPAVYQDHNLENLRILRVDGELASIVPFIVWPVEYEGCRFSHANISPTATAVAHRKKGYGLQCLKDCTRKMEAMGVELSILRTQIATFPFYEAGDYQAVQTQAWTYRLTRADAAAFKPHNEEVIEANPLTREQLAAVQTMHEAEGGGSHRTADRYTLQFALPKMKTLIAHRRGQPVGYLLVSNAFHMPGLIEAGGDQGAVETLIHRALSALGEADARVAHANLNPSVISRVLDKRLPGRRQATKENRMIRINLPGQFIRKISPWLERVNHGYERAFSIAVAGETISFRFEKDGLKLGADRLPAHHDLTRRQLASFVFGNHPSYPPEPVLQAGDIPPYYYPVWMLDRS